MLMNVTTNDWYMEALSTDKCRSNPDFPLISKAKGAYLYDVNGTGYIDGTSGSGVVNLGHQHPRVIEAVINQLEKLVHTGCKCPSDIRRKMVLKLGDFSPYEKCSILPTVTGAEAVEAALKVARAYTKRKAIISFEHAFHGKTTGALSVTWRKDYKEFSDDPSPNFFVSECPQLNAKDSQDHLDGCLYTFQQTIKKAFENNRPIAAVIIEPIQVTEGILPVGKNFLENIIKMAHDVGALVILDEIFTGFGRTGEKFYSCKLKEKPDILMVGKGLGNGFPISAVLGDSVIIDSLPAEVQTSTHSGYPLSCAAACSVIEEMNEKLTWIDAKEKGQRICEFLKAKEMQYDFVTSVRGEGMLLAFDCIDKNGNPSSPIAKDFIKRALDKKLILSCGGYQECTVRIIPPLTISEHDINYMLSIIDEVLSELQIKL